MSTEIKTEMKDHTLVTFWGGSKRGLCLQVSCSSGVDGPRYIQLTLEEAAILQKDLGAFIDGTAIESLD